MSATGGRALALVAVLVVLALGGCALPGEEVAGDAFDPDDPPGHVAGYAADDRLGLDGSEPLTEAELEAVTYRAMARIELLRGLEFREDVEVEVIDREEYREDVGVGEDAGTVFHEELWRGAFVVDGETGVATAFEELYGEAVGGYYVDGRIVLVSDDPETVRIDRNTLVHELVHALQDQQFGLERSGERLDERRAELGLIEGEADYLPVLYAERCEGEWECLTAPPRTVGEPATERFNVGLFLSIYAPYSEGPSFVADLREEGGWEAVDAAYDDPPASTSQLIHPDRYPDDRPVEPAIADRSNAEWEPFTDRDGERRVETVGEATIFASLWANGVVDRSLLYEGEGLSPYNYSHPTTAGWAGDAFSVYGDGDEVGHVWKLEWRSASDAESFERAYRDLLAENGANERDGAHQVPDGEPFAGAYHVDREGTTVTVVGGPTVESLADIHGIEPTVEDGHAAGSATGAEPSASVETTAGSTTPVVG